MAHRSFQRLQHRPWPIPTRRWTMRQSWHDLLFAHWPVPAAALRRLVPPGLNIQEFDGTSWVGVVPFRMSGVMQRPFPDLPGFSAFRELNLRIYVERDGKPGVWFLSLDADNRLAVWGARRFFHLPYWRARIALTGTDDRFTFHSERTDANPSVNFHARYRPISPVQEAQPGTLEHFLMERYCLYAQSPQGELCRAEVHHFAWPLQKAEAEVNAAELLRLHGLTVEGPAPLLHFSQRLDVVVWPLERLE
ncbi:MAG: DUF2071 domain-containing protein [Planctomycetia bacterium]|nr:DUF2071 domain-containing protein [Planctomycetia bacterium]